MINHRHQILCKILEISKENFKIQKLTMIMYRQQNLMLFKDLEIPKEEFKARELIKYRHQIQCQNLGKYIQDSKMNKLVK